MHTPHVASGGRYPVLRTLAILYVFGAAGLLCYGLYRVVHTIFMPAGYVSDRLVLSLLIFGITILVVIATLMAAELIKLLIDVEHHTRAMAPPPPSPSPAAAPAATDDLEQESAEAALIRGH
jgi:hypothetical protein